MVTFCAMVRVQVVVVRVRRILLAWEKGPTGVGWWRLVPRWRRGEK